VQYVVAISHVLPHTAQSKSNISNAYYIDVDVKRFFAI